MKKRIIAWAVLLSVCAAALGLWCSAAAGKAARTLPCEEEGLILSITTFDGKSESKPFLKCFGHTWIGLDNRTGHTVYLKDRAIPDGEMVTFSVWAVSGLSGLLFDLEPCYIANYGRYTGRLSLSTNIGEEQLKVIEDYMEQHLSECPACRAELEQMEKPVPVQPEPQPDAPLKNIRSSLNRRRLRTMLCSFAAALALAAVCGFGWYGYTACDRVSFFDARLQAYYQQAENGANGWVLETRAEDVYLKPTHADWHYEAIRYRIPWVHDTLDKLLKKDTDLLRSTGWMRTDHSAVVDAADMTAAFNGQDGTWYAVGSEPAAWDEVEWPE